MEVIHTYKCSICGKEYKSAQEATECEKRDAECPCMHDRYISTARRVTGYGRTLHVYIDFMDKSITTHYDYACDSGHDYSFPISFCPLCGRKLL